jgi:hypothetical protein
VIRNLWSYALIVLLVCASALPAAAQAPSVGAVTRLALDLAAPEPANARVIDRPGDDGTGLYIVFDMPGGPGIYIIPEIQIGGTWRSVSPAPIALETIPRVGDLPKYFGHWPSNPEQYALLIDQSIAPAAAAPATDAEGQTATEESPADAGAAPAAEAQPLEPGSYATALTIVTPAEQRRFEFAAVTVRENGFQPSRLNVLVMSIILAMIILVGVYLARVHPGKLFIRRIAGLEAVEEAIGRATEMGKPVMQINGLDPLTTLSTLAAVNILGQIARKVAHYDSRLMVPSFDPVVMTVSQETVRAAYAEEGRPDAYREEDIFFVTDQQFSYVASVCGLMLRERPAAIFLLGYFYAESLLLAETGQSTGAIQIAGTDSQSQLPFFITTCDYTLIGEELYAASAYLAREPMLLGSLKGLDVAKLIVMVLILTGTILATLQVDLLTQIFTPIN